ncbi:hypothetical protein PINS_up012509 [Pythium insidiosum]|nr:hypothetical protein PINS_up012509 [Pythium insidiosum]
MILICQALCAVFLYVLGRAHWFVDNPDMAYFANLLVPPESHALRIWGTILLTLSVLYLVDITVALFLIWERASPERWAKTRDELRRRSGLHLFLDRHGQSQIREQGQHRVMVLQLQRSRKLLRSAGATICHGMYTAILKIFGHQGWLGIDNPRFSSIFGCRELLEIVAQCVQLERTHALISRRWINQVFSIFAFLDCWSTPFIEHQLRHQPAIVPLVCVLVDVVLAMGTCVVLPAVIFLPYVIAFDWPTRSFSMEMMYNDALYAELVMENRMVFFVSTLDGITSTIPHIGILASLRATRGCIDRLTQPIRSPSIAKIMSTNRIAVAPSTSQVPARVATRPHLSHPQHSRRLLWTVHIIMGAIGLALLGLEIQSSTVEPLVEPHSCQAHVHPWLASKASCSIFKYNCIRFNSTSPTDSSFDMLELDSLLILIVAHCPELRVPSAIGNIPSLIGFEIYNSTIATWDGAAAIDHDTHKRLSYLAIVRSNMSEFPQGMQRRLPSMLLDIELVATNLSSVPDTLDTLWQQLSILYIERSLFTEIPDVLRRLRIYDFSFAGNLVESLSDDFFNSSHDQFWLWLAGNPLRALPDHVDAVQSIGFLSLENTRVTSLPPWVFSAVTRRIYAGGAPICENAQREDLSMIVDCSVAPDRAQGRYPFSLVTNLRPV